MQFLQELVRRDEEGILVEHASDNHHRMNAQAIHHLRSTKLGGVVNTDDWISVLRRDVIDTALVLHPVIAPEATLLPMGGVPDKAGEREATGCALFQRIVDQGEDVFPVEAAFAEKGPIPGVKLELATRLGGGNWDSLILKSPHILGALLGIDDMDRSLAALEAF